jgi:phenylacetate-coenzyme A ligase PaaK-like adenylate-forming protein
MFAILDGFVETEIEKTETATESEFENQMVDEPSQIFKTIYENSSYYRDFLQIYNVALALQNLMRIFHQIFITILLLPSLL